MSETINSKIFADPTRYFEVNGEKCPLLCAPVTLAAANAQLVIAAVTAKRIRVMGFDAQSTTAANAALNFDSGSGGTLIWGPVNLPLSTSGILIEKPVINSGYFETATGVGLYADVATTGAFVNVYYITYTP